MAIIGLVDGGCLNNQDPAKRQAYGSFYLTEGLVSFEQLSTNTVICRQTFELGNKTNNEAEYGALIACLRYCIEAGLTQDVFLGTDSDLVWKQLHGLYKVKDSKIKTLYEETLGLMKQFSSLSISKVPREVNVFYLGH